MIIRNLTTPKQVMIDLLGVASSQIAIFMSCSIKFFLASSRELTHAKNSAVYNSVLCWLALLAPLIKFGNFNQQPICVAIFASQRNRPSKYPG